MTSVADLLSAAAPLSAAQQVELAAQLRQQAVSAALEEIAAAVRAELPDATQVLLDYPAMLAGTSMGGVSLVYAHHDQPHQVVERINARLDQTAVEILLDSIRGEHDGVRLYLDDMRIKPIPVYED